MKKLLMTLSWVLFFAFLLVTLSPITNAKHIMDSQVNEIWSIGERQKAVIAWEHLAEGGNQNASWRLVMIYLGQTSLNANLEKAIYWLTKLSDQGVADAKETLGDLYYYGALVPQDYVLARRWYADYVLYEQDPDILTRYGILLAAGQGGEAKRVNAWALFYKAGSEDYIPAYLLGLYVYDQMTHEEQEKVKNFINAQSQQRRIQ